MSDPFVTHFLDPADVMLSRSPGGVIQAVIEGKSYPGVVLSRVFPLSQPRSYISFLTAEGEEIGIVARLDDLETESRAVADAELKFRYLIPVVTQVVRIAQEPGLWIWDLQTDRGPVQMLMRNLHEHVHTVSDDRYLITDMEGKRCEIARVSALDAHSKKQLNKVT